MKKLLSSNARTKTFGVEDVRRHEKGKGGVNSKKLRVEEGYRATVVKE
jgi:hypothetical protein